MIRLAALRIVGALPNLLGVIVVTFLLTRALPGDPAAYFAGQAASVEAIEQIRTKLGLDRPLPVQFVDYLRDLLRGNLGQSLSTGQPVTTELVTRLPASIELTLVALLLAVSISLPLGIAAAVRRGTWVDQLARLVTTAGVSLPVFFTGLLLTWLFYFELGWAPSPIGRLDPSFSPPAKVTGLYLVDAALARDGELWWACAKQLVMPSITMALFVLAPITRMTRASMLSVLSSDFVRTARALGLRSPTVLVRYALRNALLPVVTTLGMVASFMLGSNVLVEKVFSWPGIGSFAIESLTASDYAPVQGFVLTMGVLYVLLNLAIDLAYLLIDPRVALQA
jgi:ABC-type dipeptide/oligopeptide/nickel transport system permease component